MLRWEKRDVGLYVGFGADEHGKFAIRAKKGPDGYALDRAYWLHGAWSPWELLLEGAWPTIKAAKAAAEGRTLEPASVASESMYEWSVKRTLVREPSWPVNGAQVTQPYIVWRAVRAITDGDPREHMVIFFLDTRAQIIGYSIAAIGTGTYVPCEPHEVFRAAIVGGARSIILAHNHPSGVSDPSDDDLDATRRMVECGRILGIEVLDHVIVSERNYVSLREKGKMP